MLQPMDPRDVTTGSTTVTYSSPVNFQIPQSPPSNVPKDLKPVFQQIYDCFQNVIHSFQSQLGVGSAPQSAWTQLSGSANTVQANNVNRFYAQAGANLLLGDMVSLKMVGALMTAVPANAVTNALPADGFCNVSGGTLSGVVTEIILSNGVVANSGSPYIAGQRYWLSASAPGKLVTSRPIASGNIEQYIGIAIDANNLYVNIGGYYTQH
jgi:hypothetical protein